MQQFSTRGHDLDALSKALDHLKPLEDDIRFVLDSKAIYKINQKHKHHTVMVLIGQVCLSTVLLILLLLTRETSLIFSVPAFAIVVAFIPFTLRNLYQNLLDQRVILQKVDEGFKSLYKTYKKSDLKQVLHISRFHPYVLKSLKDYILNRQANCFAEAIAIYRVEKQTDHDDALVTMITALESAVKVDKKLTTKVLKNILVAQ